MLKLRKLRCSFCRRDENEIAKLVAGPRVYICDQCVRVASRIMEGHDGEPQAKVEPTVWRKLMDLVGRLFHNRKAAASVNG
jgi:ATP-dependent protease Clp ATPase subunit